VLRSRIPFVSRVSFSLRTGPNESRVAKVVYLLEVLHVIEVQLVVD